MAQADSVTDAAEVNIWPVSHCIAFERHFQRPNAEKIIAQRLIIMAETYSPFADNGNAMLPPFQVMSVGQYLQSPNGQYRLVFQSDANLALYQGDQAIWAANEDVPYSQTIKLNTGRGASSAYNRGTLEVTDYMRKRQWNASPSTYPAEDRYRVYCVLQDDGNIVLTVFKPLWQSDAGRAVVPDARGIVSFAPGTRLDQGREYHAGDKRIVFQGDGNLVVYDANSAPVWNSGTQNQGGDEAVMQPDGNFVIYNSKEGRPLWNSQTAGNPNAYAMLTDNGCFSVLTQEPIWARFGFTPTIQRGKPRSKGGISLSTPQIVIWTF